MTQDKTTPTDTFNWQKGGRLKNSEVEPLGQVREKGLPKITSSLHADPKLRKAARKQKLLQSKSKANPKDWIIEETNSGLHEDFTPSNAERLIAKPNQQLQKKAGRFGSLKKTSKSSEK